MSAFRSELYEPVIPRLTRHLFRGSHAPGQAGGAREHQSMPSVDTAHSLEPTFWVGALVGSGNPAAALGGQLDTSEAAAVALAVIEMTLANRGGGQVACLQLEEVHGGAFEVLQSIAALICRHAQVRSGPIEVHLEDDILNALKHALILNLCEERIPWTCVDYGLLINPEGIWT